jgi:hypothetical protein
MPKPIRKVEKPRLELRLQSAILLSGLLLLEPSLGAYRIPEAESLHLHSGADEAVREC